MFIKTFKGSPSISRFQLWQKIIVNVTARRLSFHPCIFVCLFVCLFVCQNVPSLEVTSLDKNVTAEEEGCGHKSVLTRKNVVWKKKLRKQIFHFGTYQGFAFGTTLRFRQRR
jgi:hypothetical protein